MALAPGCKRASVARVTDPRFADFANQWVPLGLARTIAADRPFAFVVADERIVVFRDAHGRLSALHDRCPHRGVALSLGRIEKGELQCPFHGWRFDGAGACTHVPWNPQARRDSLGATALPVCEVAGVVWLYTGLTAIGTPSIPEILTRPGLRLSAQTFLWNVHWTRVMENMLDAPHLPFVHKGTIGRALKGKSERRMDMEWRETATGAQIVATREGEAARTALRYHYPNVMELAIDPGGRTLRLLAVCTPERLNRTRLTLYTVRSFAKWPWLDPLFARVNARIAAEDKAIVESSLPACVPAPGAERSVASDGPTLAFRKLWFTRIRDPKPPEPSTSTE
ncbi:aromatic ring-hydroxylating dioxygenase subunit alpha [Novosphingobium profundi]|nr:aromatic ring-hydroxylating dioxygenase subunit alpha [Novosphingobium profundi]MBT0666773.1 aromatic ring-hydroxylating dioxygenase subunit alpha [Novosphingobium profundi]